MKRILVAILFLCSVASAEMIYVNGKQVDFHNRDTFRPQKQTSSGLCSEETPCEVTGKEDMKRVADYKKQKTQAVKP